MMNYELFKDVVVERIMDFLPPFFAGSEPVVEKVKKVNREMDALTIRPKDGGQGVALPIIYLNDMYDAFAVNEDMDDILAFAAEIIVNFTGAIEPERCEVDRDSILEGVIPNLINTKENRDLLKNVPHRKVLDMSIIYRVMMESSVGGYDTLVVTNSLLESAGIDADELNMAAFENLRSNFPVHLDSIQQENPEENSDFPDRFVFVSSRQQLFGAAYMLCNDVLEDIADEMDAEELYVIPFSIDEFCLVRADDKYIEQLVDLLYHRNCDLEDGHRFLSSTIYSFEKTAGKIVKKASYKARRKAVNL